MSKITKLDTEHYTITLVGEDYTTRRAPKPVRVYAPYVKPDMDEPAYSVKGEDKAIDAAWRKYNREEVRLMDAELDRCHAEVLDRQVDGQPNAARAAVLEALEMKLRFSRKAGCSCGCSGGFVGTHRVYLAGHGALQQVSISRKAVERTFTFADFDTASA